MELNFIFIISSPPSSFPTQNPYSYLFINNPFPLLYRGECEVVRMNEQQHSILLSSQLQCYTYQNVNNRN